MFLLLWIAMDLPGSSYTLIYHHYSMIQFQGFPQCQKMVVEFFKMASATRYKDGLDYGKLYKVRFEVFESVKLLIDIGVVV